MLFKFLISLILLFLAYGIVVWLLKRLSYTTERLAELQSQLARNDEVLSVKLEALQTQRRALQEQQAQLDAAKAGEASSGEAMPDGASLDAAGKPQ